jgi:hypothetical protein
MPKMFKKNRNELKFDKKLLKNFKKNAKTYRFYRCGLVLVSYNCIYSSFLSLATGILSCSRYLATVRRAM